MNSSAEDTTDNSIIDDDNSNNDIDIDNNTDGNSGNPPSDRKIYVGGYFDYSDGSVTRSGFAVADDNGEIINGFFNPDQIGLKRAADVNSNYFDNGVRSIALSNNYIYVAGSFTGYDSTLTNVEDPGFQYLQRYSYTGVLDENYTPLSGQTNINSIYAVKVLVSNGDVILGGDFSLGTRYFLNKLNSSQYLENSFSPISSSGGSGIYSLYRKSDNTVIAGGLFNDVGATSPHRNYAAFDSSAHVYNPAVYMDSIPNSQINTIEMNESEDILFLGGQDNSAGFLKKLIFSSGKYTVDSAFNNEFMNIFQRNYSFFYRINAIKTDDQGRIYVGGRFNDLEDGLYVDHSAIMRLLPSGDIDPAFQLEFTCQNAEVFDIEIQSDGKILLGGLFSMINGQSEETVNGLVRVDESGALDPDFNPIMLKDPNLGFPYPKVYDIVIDEVQ